jgi:hypothetical protein
MVIVVIFVGREEAMANDDNMSMVIPSSSMTGNSFSFSVPAAHRPYIARIAIVVHPFNGTVGRRLSSVAIERAA